MFWIQTILKIKQKLEINDIMDNQAWEQQNRINSEIHKILINNKLIKNEKTNTKRTKTNRH